MDVRKFPTRSKGFHQFIYTCTAHIHVRAQYKHTLTHSPTRRQTEREANIVRAQIFTYFWVHRDDASGQNRSLSFRTIDKIHTVLSLITNTYDLIFCPLCAQCASIVNDLKSAGFLSKFIFQIVSFYKIGCGGKTQSDVIWICVWAEFKWIPDPTPITKFMMQIRFHQFIHSQFISLTLPQPALPQNLFHSFSRSLFASIFRWHIHHIRLTWKICVSFGGQYIKKMRDRKAWAQWIAPQITNWIEQWIQYSRGLVNFMTVTITAPIRDIFNFTIRSDSHDAADVS